MFHIAVVDDSDAWCFVVQQWLQLQGYTVSTFTSPQAFLREVDRFDLALIDFSMPAQRHQIEMDGIELIRRVCQQVVDPPKMILISSFFTDDILERAAELSPEADACVGKSVGSEELMSCIERLLAGKRPKQQRPSRNDFAHSDLPERFRFTRLDDAKMAN